ncbi:hypothetical protein H648_40390gpHYPp3 [Human mastadenovirus D]|uniref:Uncharacterized protein n=1 Tax=Human mastadenovirus D TaxID=130310 RepID=T1UHC2_9ADEN|nr:hypothetical protein H648_40390gpHYPp3 [Human mastadenovirus D]
MREGGGVHAANVVDIDGLREDADVGGITAPPADAGAHVVIQLVRGGQEGGAEIGALGLLGAEDNLAKDGVRVGGDGGPLEDVKVGVGQADRVADEVRVGVLQLGDELGGDEDVHGAVVQRFADDVITRLSFLLPQLAVEGVLLVILPVLPERESSIVRTVRAQHVEMVHGLVGTAALLHGEGVSLSGLAERGVRQGEGIPNHDFQELVLEIRVVAAAVLPELEIGALLREGVRQSESDVIEENLARPRHEIAGDAERARDGGSVVDDLGGEDDLVEAVDVVPDDVEFHESRAAFDVRQLFEFLVGEVLGALQAVLLERPLLEMWVGLHE